ncbi:MAG: hypothetical protein K9G69_03165 [Candidatus Nanopelagicales bacterium]|nr:hypothetical protein [Candidatus Nanopelagicales bacterium]
MGSRPVALQAAVLGHPISHSLSPVLHSAAIAALGINCEYSAIDVTESTLGAFLEQLGNNWVGLSLTMPLKNKVLEFIGPRDHLVESTQVANTVYRNLDGDWALANTDVFGLVTAVQQAGVEAPRHVVILGSGSTARSAVQAAAELGAVYVDIRARNQRDREALVVQSESVGMHAHQSDLSLTGLTDVDLVISTLPNGVDIGTISAMIPATGAALLDVAYSPWPSSLARQWPHDRVISGLDMLLWQATRQSVLFYGGEAPVDQMRRALFMEERDIHSS